MIREIVEQIIRPILVQLPWVDVFGGITTTTTKTLRSGETETFPVMVVAGSNCPPSGEPIIAPDARFKSVLWMTEESDLESVIDTRFPRRSARLYTEDVRLLVWLNGPALGEDSHNFGYTAQQDILRVLGDRKILGHQLANVGLSSDTGLNQIRIQSTGVVEKNVEDIFGEYSFAHQKWFVKPYDFFAVDMTIEFTTINECMPEMLQNDPLACPPGPRYVPIVSDCEGNLIQVGADGGACLTIDDIPGGSDGNGIFSALNENGLVGVNVVRIPSPPNELIFQLATSSGGIQINGGDAGYNPNGDEVKLSPTSLTFSDDNWFAGYGQDSDGALNISSLDLNDPSFTEGTIRLSVGGGINETVKIEVKDDYVRFPEYGVGVYDDTPTRLAGWNGFGDFVEIDPATLGGDGNGLFDGGNNGKTCAVSTIALTANVTFSGARNKTEIIHGGAVQGLRVRTDLAGSGISIGIRNGNGTEWNLESGTLNGPFSIKRGTTRVFEIHESSPADSLRILTNGQLRVLSGYASGTFDDGSPVRLLGVNASGDVVGVVPATLLTQARNVDPTEIVISPADFNLPPITTIGQIQIVAHDGPGIIQAIPDGGNTISGTTSIGPNTTALFIAITLNRWGRIESS